MSAKEKLIKRFCSLPNDFTWSEYCALLESFGYALQPGSGSRRKFASGAFKVSCHEPHPKKIVKMYVLRETLKHLKERGLI